MDIVERLRDPEQGLTSSDRSHLHKAAATEIERLQAAKRRALAIADERAKEAVGLRAALKDACDWFDQYRPQWGPRTLPAWRVDARGLVEQKGPAK